MGFQRRYAGAEPQRVNRWLAQEGVCSRRDAETMILRGEVFIDGEKVADVGRKILPGQILELGAGGEASLGSVFTAVLNKPPGFVSGQPEPGRTPAVRLLTAERREGPPGPAGGAARSLPPLGRLDLDSRGLLLLSDDGVLARALISPQSRLDKEYLVQVQGRTGPGELRRLRHGLVLDGRPLKPAQVDLLPDGRLRFILHEGRNRQIRRMCALVGLSVLDLLRTRIGPLVLGDLPEGRWRLLTASERQTLIHAAGANSGPEETR